MTGERRGASRSEQERSPSGRGDHAADEVDRGLSSIADLRVLGRLLFYGLVLAVVIGVVVAVFTRRWLVVLAVVGAYAVIASIQWLAVHHRMHGGRDPR